MYPRVHGVRENRSNRRASVAFNRPQVEPLEDRRLLSDVTVPAEIVSGQFDNFQDGTLAGWGNGVFTSTTNVATGGPQGTGDRFLRVTSDGDGPAGKLVVFNTTQWAGNYTAAGVGSVSMDVSNLGATDLSLRLWLEGPGGWFVSKTPTPLPPGSGWRPTAFSVRPADLTFVANTGSNNVSATLGGVTRFRIYHAPQPVAPGPQSVAALGIDNILAGTALPTYNLEATPRGPLTVPAGGSITFAYAITNRSTTAVQGDFFYSASPGNVAGIINSGSLAAGATVNGTYVQNIAANVPPGTYTYRLNIGNQSSPPVVADQETFTLIVTPASATGGVAPAWTANSHRTSSPAAPADDQLLRSVVDDLD